MSRSFAITLSVYMHYLPQSVNGNFGFIFVAKSAESTRTGKDLSDGFFFRLGRVEASGSVSLKHALHFVANLAKHLQLFLFSPFCVRWIFKWPMVTIHLPRKDWAGLVGLSTNGNHRFHADRLEFVQMFRSMLRNIDVFLLHHFYGKRMHVTGGLRTGALNVQNVTGKMSQKSFSNVAPARVAGAQNQNGRLFVTHMAVLPGNGQYSGC